jgi:hypothetical protein
MADSENVAWTDSPSINLGLAITHPHIRKQHTNLPTASQYPHTSDKTPHSYQHTTLTFLTIKIHVVNQIRMPLQQLTTILTPPLIRWHIPYPPHSSGTSGKTTNHPHQQTPTE